MQSERDSQRSAVYLWENLIRQQYPESDGVLALDQCKELVARVWCDYRPGHQPPTVHDGRGTRKARGGRWEINLPVWARRRLIVLHEIAHSLQTGGPWHGPHFATLALDLWEHYARVPREARKIGIHLKPRRVHFAVAADIPQKKSAAWLRWNRTLESLKCQYDEHRKAEPER